MRYILLFPFLCVAYSPEYSPAFKLPQNQQSFQKSIEEDALKLRVLYDTLKGTKSALYGTLNRVKEGFEEGKDTNDTIHE